MGARLDRWRTGSFYCKPTLRPAPAPNSPCFPTCYCLLRRENGPWHSHSWLCPHSSRNAAMLIPLSPGPPLKPVSSRTWGSPKRAGFACFGVENPGSPKHAGSACFGVGNRGSPKHAGSARLGVGIGSPKTRRFCASWGGNPGSPKRAGSARRGVGTQPRRLRMLARDLLFGFCGCPTLRL